MTWASDNVKKFAVIGTSCSGKTTLTLSILAHLKQMGISCDGVLQQDRRFAFDRIQLEKYKEAQYYFICNQIMRETELTLRGHCEVIVSDRSPLDLYAYYVVMYGRDKTIEDFIHKWIGSTYDQLYYLHPLPYEDDKQRPSNEFRLQVASILEGLITKLGYQEIIRDYEDRSLVLKDILEQIGHKLQDVDLKIIPDALGVSTVLVGGSYAFNRATKYSDLDVYVYAPADDLNKRNTYQKKLESILGIKVDIHMVESTLVWTYLLKQGFRVIERSKYNA